MLSNDKFRLRVLAGLAKNELLDKDIEQLTKSVRIVGTIDNVSIILLIERGLSTKFASEEFGGIGRGATEGSGDVGHIRNDGLNPVALAFDFGSKEGHATN